MVPDEVTLADAAMVSLARDGDVGAFNQLVERYQSLVYNVCRRMLTDPEQAADATQETFFAAYRSLRSLRDGAFKAWLLRIASNQCYDVLRHRQRHPTEPLPDAGPPEMSDPDRLPEEAALDRETALALEAAIRLLPPDRRMCLLLVDVQGLDYREAAQALSINVGTVKSRLSRARAELRELLPAEFRLQSGE
ncbi:MAG: RNA polymerase sigma factor [Chloroflexota bacterium]